MQNGIAIDVDQEPTGVPYIIDHKYDIYKYSNAANNNHNLKSSWIAHTGVIIGKDIGIGTSTWVAKKDDITANEKVYKIPYNSAGFG